MLLLKPIDYCLSCSSALGNRRYCEPCVEGGRYVQRAEHAGVTRERDALRAEVARLREALKRAARRGGDN